MDNGYGDYREPTDPIESKLATDHGQCPALDYFFKARAKLDAEREQWESVGTIPQVIKQREDERIQEITEKINDLVAQEYEKAETDLATYEQAFKKQRDKNPSERLLIRERLRDRYVTMTDTELEDFSMDIRNYTSMSDSEEYSILRAELARRNLKLHEQIDRDIKENGLDRWITMNSEKAANAFRRMRFYKAVSPGHIGLLWDGRQTQHSVADLLKRRTK